MALFVSSYLFIANESRSPCTVFVIASINDFHFAPNEAKIGEAQVILNEYADAVSTLKRAVRNSHDVHSLCLLRGFTSAETCLVC